MPTSQEMKAKLRKQKRVGSSASKKVSIPRLQKKKKHLKDYGQNARSVTTSVRLPNSGSIYSFVQNVVTIIASVVRNIMIFSLTKENSLSFLKISAVLITSSLRI